MTVQYGELRPIGPLAAEIVSLVWGAPAISTGFASWLRYRSDVARLKSTKLCTMFGRLLSWYRPTIVQVLRSSVLEALLHGTGAVGARQSLRHGTRNGIMELSLLIIFNRGRHLYSEGGHHVGHRPTF